MTHPLASSAAPQVLVVPDWRRDNPYLDMLGEAVQSAHLPVRVVFASPEGGALALWRLARRHPQARTLHLQWLNHFIASVAWGRWRWLRAVKLWLFESELALLRLTGHRIVWTIHNLYTHESTDRPLERRMYRAVARWASAVLAHSEEALALAQREYGLALGAKGHVVPHGNYTGRYPETKRDPASIDPRLTSGDSVQLLFFGALRPYKGITELLAALAAAPNARVTVAIAGKGQDAQLERAVQAHAAQDPRVVPLIRFIAEEEVATLFAWADAVVVPFERTLTSGSVILAMTMGRPVVLPDSARVIGIATDANCVFFPPGGLPQVLEQLGKAELQRRREACLQTAAGLDWPSIGQRLAQIYGLRGKSPDSLAS